MDNWEVVQLLLKNKADVHVCDANELPDGPLASACSERHTNTVEVLLRHNANVARIPPDYFRFQQPIDDVAHCMRIGLNLLRTCTTFDQDMFRLTRDAMFSDLHHGGQVYRALAELVVLYV